MQLRRYLWTRCAYVVGIQLKPQLFCWKHDILYREIPSSLYSHIGCQIVLTENFRPLVPCTGDIEMLTLSIQMWSSQCWVIVVHGRFEPRSVWPWPIRFMLLSPFFQGTAHLAFPCYWGSARLDLRWGNYHVISRAKINDTIRIINNTSTSGGRVFWPPVLDTCYYCHRHRRWL